MTYASFFNCRYPIISVPMTLVSDVKLAVAVHSAGGFPSIASTNYYKGATIDLQLLEAELLKFADISGSTDVLINLDKEVLLEDRLTNFIIDNNFKFIELFGTPIDPKIKDQIALHIQFLKERHGVKIIFKSLKNPHHLNQGTIILKGPDGAGRTNLTSGTLDENFDRIKNTYPSINIIPSGGISTREDVRHFMGKGSLAVGIGTLLAMSEESPIAHDTKMKLLKITSNDVTTFGNLNIQGVRLGDISNDSDNYTRSLYKGIRSANEGAIFVGKGINKVSAIKPVKDIIEELVQNDYQ